MIIERHPDKEFHITRTAQQSGEPLANPGYTPRPWFIRRGYTKTLSIRHPVPYFFQYLDLDLLYSHHF